MQLDIRDVVSTLIETALKGEQLEFRLLTSAKDYLRCRYRRSSLKSIIKVLSSCAKRLLKNYCKDIEVGQQQATKLLACVTINSAVDFYKKDLKVIEQMLGEYEIYLMSGNQLDFIFFRTRKEDNLTDFRRLF